MTGTFTLDYAQPWRRRSEFLQAPQPTHARTPKLKSAAAQPVEPPGYPDDWPILRTKIVKTLQNFPDAYDAFVRVLNEHYPEPLYT